MSMFILGIDPGLDGGLAFYCPTDTPSSFIWPMPTLTIKKSGKTKSGQPKQSRIINDYQLGRDMGAVAPFVRMAFVENVHPMPKQGIVSAGKFMDGFGQLKGLLAGLGIPRTMVEPPVWKRRMGLPVGALKGDSIARAQALLPFTAKIIGNRDGMAEALLIAIYGANNER